MTQKSLTPHTNTPNSCAFSFKNDSNEYLDMGQQTGLGPCFAIFARHVFLSSVDFHTLCRVSIGTTKPLFVEAANYLHSLDPTLDKLYQWKCFKKCLQISLWPNSPLLGSLILLLQTNFLWPFAELLPT